jgi:phytoene synthase
LPVFAIKDLLEGLISDQGTVLLLNENQLIQYSYKVAGTVGLMMAPILGISSKKAIPFAVDLGIAMQLTNISRDVLEDAKLGRRYIPGEWCDDLSAPEIVKLGKDGTTEDRLKVSAAIKRTLLLAETYYISGFKGLAYLPPRNHLAILIAGIIYRLIGRRLLNSGTKWWLGRQVVNNTGKLLHSLYPPLLMLNRFKRLPAHESHLHKCLKDYLDFD